MGRIEKTVFISYRRTNTAWALAIYQHLTSQGYDVFFDYLSIPSGDFEKTIIENIRGRAHFIVILTPSSLERCNEPGDWLRREIETALEDQRNIVPLMLESFDFGSPATTKAMTGRLIDLKKYNALRVPSEYFFEAMDRLREQFLNIELQAVLHPVSNETRQVTQEQKNAADDAQRVEQEQLSAVEWFERGFKLDDNSEEEIRCYTEAIRLAPSFYLAFNNRGVVHDIRGDLDQALQDFEEVIRLERDYHRAYYNRGRVRRDMGDLDGALQDFDKAIRINPADASPYFSRGNTLSAKGDNLNALLDLQKASELDPENGAYRPTLVRVLRALGRSEESREQKQIALTLIHKANEYNRACFEAICGNIESALELLKIGLEKRQANKEWARQDPDFESIRDDPRFKALVGE